jgi:hypothetical protein
MSDAHEADIAEWTGGRLQKGSGNQFHAQGDTKNGEYLVPFPITSDGKATMGSSISISRAMWQKIVEQTFNQNPALFLRFYEPHTTRLTVDLDLGVVRAGLLVELLEKARKWQAVDDYLSNQGTDVSDDVDHVIELIRLGQEKRDEVFKELVQHDEELGLHESHPKSGCDCCR